ncbi:hypothetical protein evm_007207 [Chilo suppressalis]|nr:hypothetical protein evm_007207 [Chilo suppressalis]
MAPLQPLQLLCLFVIVTADPAPGRVPKVYNALITSNQNLEPSKAYPVYQPVLHDFAFPFQPAVFYGDYPIGNGLQPVPAAPRKDTNNVQDSNNGQPQLPQAPEQPADAKASPTENPPASTETRNAPTESDKATPAPPLPPNTESPIPLNQFGLPSQVLPLNRIDPAYNGFNQLGPFTYSYPSFRLYDPYDPFSLNPFVNFPPLYRPLPNLLEAGAPVIPQGPQVVAKAAPSEAAGPATAAPQSNQTPPPEPSDLNLLNYPSKDPAIPNVPPPPLPQGGLKSDNSE